jgi:hypothetical protein
MRLRTWRRMRLCVEYRRFEMEQDIVLLRSAVIRLVKAMRKAEEIGCMDNIDCCDDAGDFWYSALSNAKAVLVATEPKVEL